MTATNFPTASDGATHTIGNVTFTYSASLGRWQKTGSSSGGGGGSGGGVTTGTSLPSSGSAGDLFFNTATKAMYVYDGTEWDRIFSGANMMPEFTTSPNTSYTLNGSAGTAENITVAATDPEGFPVTYSYDTNPTNQTQATISQSGGAFTVTPSTDIANSGSFTMRFKATDGVNVSSKSSTMNLTFARQRWGVPSGTSDYLYTDLMNLSTIHSFSFYIVWDNTWDGTSSGHGRFWTTNQGSNSNIIWLGNLTSTITNETIGFWNGLSGGSSRFFFEVGSTYTSGTKYHVVFSMGTTSAIYVNGVPQSLSTGNSPTGNTLPFGSSTSGRLYLESYASASKMSDLCFYNAALTASEVTDIYNNNTHPSSLVNRWNPYSSEINNTTRIISPATGSTNLNWDAGMSITFSDVP